VVASSVLLFVVWLVSVLFAERRESPVPAGVIRNLNDAAIPTNHLGVEDRHPDFAVWGDSHAIAVLPLCDRMASERCLTGIAITERGYVSLIDAWANNPTIAGEIEQLKWNKSSMHALTGIRHVFLISKWGSKVPGLENMPSILSLPGKRSRSRAEAAEAFRMKLIATVEAFQGRGSHVYFVRQVPLCDLKTPSYRDQQLEVDRVLASIDMPGLTVLGPGSNWLDIRNEYYQDDNHLSEIGAEALMRPVLTPVFDSLVPTSAR
jgi:hypothetical protein